MKTNLYARIILVGLISTCSVARAQTTEVALDKKFTEATVLTFKPPYETMSVFIADDLDTRYSTLTMTPKTLFLKRALGGRKLEKLKPEDKLNAADIRPGMQISLRSDHYQISLKNEAKEVVLSDNYYGNTSLKGLFEFFDGEKASVDGQLVIIKPGTVLKGTNEWRDKTFGSFNELQLGCELNLQGKRETDGVVYVTRGTARPIESSVEDRLLRRGVDLTLKLDKDQLSIGTQFTRKFITNNVLQDYVNTVGEKVVPAYLRSLPLNHPDHIDFRYYLIDDERVNASAYPNGTVIVHTGMLKKLDNEAQLAAILGHEIAHVTQKHHAKTYRNRQNWKAVSDILTVASLVSTGYVAPAVAVVLMSEMYVSKYSRTQETQADRIGLRYMFDAGYDAREAANIWKKLAQDDMGGQMDSKAAAMLFQSMGDDTSEIPTKEVTPESRESLYESHPRSRDRFNHVNFLLSTTYAAMDYSKATLNTDGHKKMIKLLTPNPVKPTKPGSKKPVKSVKSRTTASKTTKP
ncbi:M48 family metallopeptidase [Spirosoma arcticum]